MMIYSKVLEPKDYIGLDDSIEYYRNIERTLGELVRPQHPARMWEYGRLIEILKDRKPTDMLDVGGSGSALPQCAATLGYDVTIIDFDDETQRINEQNKILNTNVKFIGADFLNTGAGKYDVVACVSTIEHVPNDDAFFIKLLDSCNQYGIVYITCDFFTSSIHPNEPPTYKNWVNRTYTKEKLEEMLRLAELKGFRLYGNECDWEWRGPQVYNYNFASLILHKGMR